MANILNSFMNIYLKAANIVYSSLNYRLIIFVFKLGFEWLFLFFLFFIRVKDQKWHDLISRVSFDLWKYRKKLATKIIISNSSIVQLFLYWTENICKVFYYKKNQINFNSNFISWTMSLISNGWVYDLMRVI